MTRTVAARRSHRTDPSLVRTELEALLTERCGFHVHCIVLSPQELRVADEKAQLQLFLQPQNLTFFTAPLAEAAHGRPRANLG